jgi:hypothetical protein
MSFRFTLLIISIATLEACTVRDEVAQVDTTAAAPNEVSLTTAEYSFKAPDSIDAGWTTFRLSNRGEEIHYGHIVRLDSGKTVQELTDAYAEAIRSSGPRPAWVTRFGGPGGTAPGQSSNVTQHLEPGEYVWICPIEDDGGTPHFSKGEVQAFMVRAAGSNAADQSPPEASAVIRLADYTFSFEAPLSSGRHKIRVENAGTEPHDVALLKLAPGTTLDHVRNLLNPERARRTQREGEQEQPVMNLVSPAGGVAAIKPGMKVFFEANLTPGEYVLVCMVTSPDGRSHIEHGMMKQFTIG